MTEDRPRYAGPEDGGEVRVVGEWTPPTEPMIQTPNPEPVRSVTMVGGPAPMTAPNVAQGAVPSLRSRARVEHSKLAKEGWRFEATVEVEWDAGTPDVEAIERLHFLMTAVHEAGQMRVAALNADDGREP